MKHKKIISTFNEEHHKKIYFICFIWGTSNELIYPPMSKFTMDYIIFPNFALNEVGKRTLSKHAWIANIIINTIQRK